MVPTSTLALHLRYTAWASARLVDAASKLSASELAHDFKTSEKSIMGTLAHVFAADRVWWHRINGTTPAKFIDPEKDFLLETLQTEWPALLAQWEEFVAAKDEAALAVKIEYKDLKGNAWATPLWQIILHVVNHGTHHRGQVAGMIRAHGQTPPPLDLIAYYRSLV
jgi:uncharacterized damage-inducible protein DinB